MSTRFHDAVVDDTTCISPDNGVLAEGNAVQTLLPLETGILSSSSRSEQLIHGNRHDQAGRVIRHFERSNEGHIGN
jgi:hypothetical protein